MDPKDIQGHALLYREVVLDKRVLRKECDLIQHHVFDDAFSETARQRSIDAREYLHVRSLDWLRLERSLRQCFLETLGLVQYAG